MNEAKIKTKKGTGLIYLSGYVQRKEVYVSIGHNLFEGARIENNYLVYTGRDKKKIKERNLINDRIHETTDAYNEAYLNFEKQNKLTAANVKAAVLAKLEYKQQNQTISDIAEEYKTGLYAHTIFSEKGAAYSYDSIRSLTASSKKFAQFCEEKNFTLFDLNERTGALFNQWLGREIEIKKDDKTIKVRASLSTIAKDIKAIKSFFRWLKDEGYIAQRDIYYQSWKKPVDIDTGKIYLSKEELKKLDEVQPEDENLLKYQFLFLIMARTGLRVSDLHKLQRPSMKKGPDGYYLELIQEKTETWVKIPLTPITKNYLDIFFDNPQISEFTPQKINKHIKTVAEKAGIDTPVLVYKKTLDGVEKETIPKHDLITCHVARHSFACNLYLEAAPLSVISRLLGHASEKQTLTYIKGALPDVVDSSPNIRQYFTF